MMTDKLFWDIVGSLDWSKWNEDEDERSFQDEMAVLELAIQRLAVLPVREIYLFHEFLNWRLYTLDTREHALHFAPGEEDYGYNDDGKPFSTDGFKDRRAMAIARGQNEYEKILADPTQMPRQGFECFAYLPIDAYKRKSGADYEYEVGINTWAGCNKAGWVREASDTNDKSPAE
jgi:hypothetical protein